MCITLISFVTHDQPYLWQQPHRKPRSPPAGLCWGFLRTLHSRPAWAAIWWTWIWHLERQTSPAAGHRKLPHPGQGKGHFFERHHCRLSWRSRWHDSHLCAHIIATLSRFGWKQWNIHGLTHNGPGVSAGTTMQDQRQDRTSLFSDLSLNISMRTL